LTDKSTKAQQTNILQYSSPNGLEYLWQGDRWQSSPDGQKGHDFSFWAPISWDSQGNPSKISWVSDFMIDITSD